MPTYTVNFTQVDHVTEEMVTISRNISNMLESLDASARQHLAEWTSEAQTAYAAAKLKWDTAAADMVQQAANAATALGEIRTSYSQAEGTNSTMWSR
ncbi:WXG100 family type VII secretion target [Streptomyces sp. NPDC059101]|uniref:WXG100 family type VII secretion target n=1 Tax=unclassified Streptomyces TaxID=2593676 RepID=UPI0036A5B2F7